MLKGKKTLIPVKFKGVLEKLKKKKKHPRALKDAICFLSDT